MKPIFVFLSCLTILSGSCAQTDESDQTGNILVEIWNLLTNGTIEHFFGCKSHDSFTDGDIGYYLHTRSNGNGSKLTLNNLNELNVTKPIKMYFNGWMMRTNDSLDLALVKAYLTRYDCNVIVVDTIKISHTQFSQAYCNNIIGAELIGDFMCEMHKQGFLDFDNLHMVGVSLGAQLMGLIGQRVQLRCNQTVDRITGVEPSGPIYQGQDVSMRLDKSDAKFVDVIHTDMGINGYYGSVGHVDFFVNCGVFQPGCVSLANLTNLVGAILTWPGCSHYRSALVFIESIYGPVFNATSCTSCPDSNGVGKCLGADIVEPKYAIMGEDCPRDPPATKFVIKTNSKAPFAQG